MRHSRNSKRLKTKITATLLFSFAFLLLGSFLAYHLFNKKALGLLDSYFSWWLIYLINAGGYFVIIVLASLALNILGVRYFKENLLKIFLWLAGLYFVFALLSFPLRSPENLGGYWGTLLAKFLYRYLGVLGALFIPFFILYGLVPYLRQTKRKNYLRYSLYCFIFLSLINLSFAYFLSNFYLKFGNFSFVAYGEVFRAIIGVLKHLIGPWGTLVLLITSWIIACLVFTNIPEQFKTIFIKAINFIKKKTKLKKSVARTRTQPEKLNESTVMLDADITQVQDIKITPEPAYGTSQKETAPEPTRSALRFDEVNFREEFLACLDEPPLEKVFTDERELKEGAKLLLEKLKEFGIEGEVTEILSGPMITRFEFAPAPGIKIQRIESLADDLALSLKAERIRILAPKSPLTFALGETITGEPYTADLREMPHVLIAGTTGSGKSVCINTMIASIIYRATQDDVRFLTIDPKQLELPIYNTIPHLLSTTTTDPRHATKGLDRIISIMETRYGIFANLGVRDIEGYNELAAKEGLPKKPYIVVIIDELADLMIRAEQHIEEKIIRLAQMSRAVGIHLVLATQRPSVDVITGLIKANFPCRIAFQVASKTDSRTILDMNGAEALLGRGDMLFLPPGKGEPIRLHCAYVSREATKRIVDLWTRRYLIERLTGLVADPYETASRLIESQVVDVLIDREKAGLKRKQELFYSIIPEEIAERLWAEEYHKPLPEEDEFILRAKSEEQLNNRAIDELFFDAARIVFRHREASVSMLQRRLDIGWARAGRIIDQLEQAGIVGPYVGSKSRKVLVETEEELEKILAKLKSNT
ncbi:MAG: DNA translocase FtsK 4TM domain-containing protein [candidate division WOR-3 bacterium]|nr:DNA translocase FtsK 4TM domain-containing protein [candidate division WOR-3 bacterium]